MGVLKPFAKTEGQKLLVSGSEVKHVILLRGCFRSIFWFHDILVIPAGPYPGLQLTLLEHLMPGARLL